MAFLAARLQHREQRRDRTWVRSGLSGARRQDQRAAEATYLSRHWWSKVEDLPADFLMDEVAAGVKVPQPDRA